MTVIPNGVDALRAFAPDTLSADVQPVLANGFDILSFGRINWKKGLDRRVKAMAEIPDASVFIAGQDEDGFEPTLRRIADECGVGERVRFLPRQIGGPDREALFNAARLFTLPSLSENFGNVVAEAM